MGKFQKKNAKGRLDRYYFLAKEKGYRARSSFKILQINEKYGHFLEKSKVVIDLCAAPGSWCQVASQLCPINSLIIGVDIVQMKPMPNVITFQSDITTEDCKSKLRGYMKNWKADTVLHDGAPNVGLNWVQDAYTQSHLTLQALKLAVENLTPGGIFVTKIFRSRDYNNLLWVFNQLFEKVEATKPPASRNVSAEIFVVCKGFKAPKKLDPRFLDPKEVFEELTEDKVNNESKVFNPELKRKNRSGYEENDYTLFHPMNIIDWVKQEDEVINTLGGVNKFEINFDEPEWKILKKLKQSTPEFYECCKDLKVLGKKDFRMLIKWRIHARDALGIISEKDKEKPVIEVEELTEDQKIDKELDDLKERQRLKRKRDKRKVNELKQKEVQRMQLNMLTDMQIGLDASNIGSESLFNLKSAEKTGELDKLIKGKKSMVFNNNDENNNQIIDDTDIVVDENNTKFKMVDSEEQLDNLEDEMDLMYSNYKERKLEKDNNLRSKIARGGDDDAWDGIKENEDDGLEDSENGDFEDDSDVDSELDSDDDEAINNLIATIERKKKGSLSSKAKSFFNDSIFQDVDMNIINSGKEQQTKILSQDQSRATSNNNSKDKDVEEEEEEEDSDDDDDQNSKDDEDSDFEVVANEYNEDDDTDYDTDSETELKEKAKESHKNDVDIATVQGMTLAHELALGKKTKKDLMNEGFNRYSFREKEGLPSWFIEEEEQHSKINRPITKEASLAIKEKMKQLNARPIKKVLEAQGRKKMRAMRRLEKLKKKSNGIMDEDGKSEADKSAEIQALMSKMTKKQKVKPKVTLVVATGSNRGLSGRPRGIKGKYKMVDGSLKNEMRALRRIEKKHKKKKKKN